MIKHQLCLIFLLAMHALPSNGQTTHVKNAGKAIICLTYDDGLDSHLLTVLPQLDALGLKATFFLNSIRGSSNVIGEVSKDVVGWSNAAASGHELANHTLFHPCPEKLGFAKAHAIESYSVDQLVKEVETQNAILTALDNKKTVRSFAYPCNNVLIGNIDYSKVLYSKGLVKFGRDGGDRNSVVADPKTTDPMHVPSWFVEEGTTAEELIAFAEKVKKEGGLGVYQFHGVGAEFFKISQETHQEFLNYLKKNEEFFLVTTFSDAVGRRIGK